jgi:PAS domain-containing protein
MADYTGLSPFEAMDWGYQTAFHPEDRPNEINECRNLFSENGPAESEIGLRRHDAIYRRFWIRVEPLRNETGQIVRMVRNKHRH